jgi:hypothetical protein
LDCDSVFNSVRRLLCVVWHIELCLGAMHRDKCMWNISARYQNCAQWILAQNAKVVHASYWHDREEMHSVYRCEKHDLPCDVVVHDKYGCTS